MKYGSFEFGGNNSDENLNPVNIETEEDFEVRSVRSIKRSAAEKEKKIRNIALSHAVELDSSTKDSAKQSIPKIESEQMKKLQKEARPVSPKPKEMQPKVHILKKETLANIGHSSAQELLGASGNLMIDGKNLRTLFETNQIDHNGLAAIIRQYLRGGDIENTYTRVKLGKEAMRGRAIEMRHDDPSFSSGSKSSNRDKARNQRIDMLRNQIIDPVMSHATEPAESSKSLSIAKINHEQAKIALSRRRNATLAITVSIVIIGLATIAWLIYS